MIILKNSLSIPKLMYILRTADCSDNELLTKFHNIVSKGLSTILNCELSGDQILQASLPVKIGGLASAALPRWHHPPSWLLPRGQRNFKLLVQVEERLQSEVPDFTRNRILERWKAISGSPPPSDEVYGKQKYWERLITEQTFSMLLTNCTSKTDKARILASKQRILATGSTHRPSHPLVCVCLMKPFE